MRILFLLIHSIRLGRIIKATVEDLKEKNNTKVVEDIQDIFECILDFVAILLG